MGLDLTPRHDAPSLRKFSHALVTDIQALERMLEEGRIESGVRRIGCEQEFVLVDRGWRPARLALELLAELGDPFTTELALFNLEANLEPVLLEGRGLGDLESRADELFRLARVAAGKHGAAVVLTGILPTLARSHLTLDSMTPRERYRALNEAVVHARGGRPRQLRMESTDELVVESDSVMLEACNTSCQVHLQVSAAEFPAFHNAAQAVLAPVLAAAVNSPLLFGKRLWAETRIALFQQSVDTRAPDLHRREIPPRVRFGDRWVKESVVELFQDDITGYPILLAGDVDEDALDVLDAGGVPRLRALQLFNSTVYRWNRPCYGITSGVPHLRIECRALPAGPSVADEIANAAFWVGAVLGVVAEYGDVARRMDFDDARSNFVAAARQGLRATFTWPGRDALPAPRLLEEVLLPLARRGLDDAGVEPELVDRYLGIITSRVTSGRTGSTWLMDSLAGMREHGSMDERLAALTSETARLQEAGAPVHEWPLAGPTPGTGWSESYRTVQQLMSTNLVTVHRDEQAEMVAFLMDRRKIRHVLVEDGDHHLQGIVSYAAMLSFLAGGRGKTPEECPVSEIMDPDPPTVGPDTPALEAIRLFRTRQVTCLPVVSEGRLVGLISERDFLPIAHRFLEERAGKDREVGSELSNGGVDP